MVTKVILVTYALGRCGSSATMGLLKIMGASVGKPERLVGARPMNPKGFFELKSQGQFLKLAFEGFYPSNEVLPPQDTINAGVEKWMPAFVEMLAQEFPTNGTVALKTQRGLTLPFWHRLRDRYDVRVLVLNRNPDDQVRSISRVWATVDDPAKRNAPPEVIYSQLEAWRGFLKEQLARVDFPKLSIDFEDLISAPHDFALKLSNFLDLTQPSVEEVTAWVDRGLVNRSEYS